MAIKRSGLKLAFVCLTATALLPACGGSSSGGGGGIGSQTYQQGYAKGTVDALDLVLADLSELHTSLAGSGAPVQTSNLGTLGRSFALLEPRQRETLAESLATFIVRVREARNAAAAANAGAAEAEAAQAAADEALQALRIVVAADAVAEVSGSETARTAAVTALTAVAEVDAAAPDATAMINEALTAAVRAAETEVARLQQALDDALAQQGQQQGDTASVISGLRQQVASLQASLTAARNSLRALDAEFGDPPSSAALTPGALPLSSVAYHPRRTGVQVYFENTFDPASSNWRVADDYVVQEFGSPATGGIDLNPAAVLYNPAGSNRRVFAASSPNLSRFPARGTTYRGVLRRVLSTDRDDSDAASDASITTGSRASWVYRDADRLIRMGADPNPEFPASGASNSGWNNWDAAPRTTFQYKSDGGLAMAFGGEGVIFGDLERYAAKGQKNCGSGGDEYCDDANAVNIEISFGSPVADPFRQPHTNFWMVRAASPRLPGVASAVDAATAITPDLSAAGNQVEAHNAGRYELVLSNYAGIDDRDTEAESDDAERLLSYAAYGLFQFMDFSTANPRTGRMQTFHYGVDAFSGADNRGTADLTGNDTIEGTFQGKTLGWIVVGQDATIRHGQILYLHRTRGDIELRACIGGANCAFGAGTDDDLDAAMITGTITNLEYAHGSRSDNTYWSQGDLNSPGFTDKTVTLRPAAITDEGTYAGVADGGVDTRAGTYEGAFYGPVGAGLETAGTWQLGAPDWARGWDGLIGSFGAVCADGCASAAP